MTLSSSPSGLDEGLTIPRTIYFIMEDFHDVPLTTQEVQYLYDTLIRKRFYKGMHCPLGNPYSEWMEATLLRLKPFAKRTYD